MMKYNFDYPSIPEKQYFSIGETAALVCTKPHILRYWEKEIGGALKLVHRHHRRRYYNRNDILLLRRINNLLYEEGMTISGVQVALKGESTRMVTTNHQAWLRKEIEKVINLL